MLDDWLDVEAVVLADLGLLLGVSGVAADTEKVGVVGLLSKLF